MVVMASAFLLKLSVLLIIMLMSLILMLGWLVQLIIKLICTFGAPMQSTLGKNISYTHFYFFSSLL